VRNNNNNNKKHDAARPLTLPVLALLSLALQAHAQQAPDAGSLLRQQPASPAAVPAPPLVPGPATSVKGPVLQGPRFQVKEFRFKGASLVTEAELRSVVEPYVDQNLTLGILQAIAEQVTGYYLQKGYLARVLVPEQEIKGGVVLLQVIEGQRGSLLIEKAGRRVDAERVAAIINQRLGAGESFNVARLDEALAILNEQPGVKAASSLKPGGKEGEVAVVVSAEDRPLFAGTVGINNTGGRASGVLQTQGQFVLSNPTGNFDAASLLANVSEGTRYLRGEYSLAIGSSGLRLGANASALRYRIIEESLRPLDLHGTGGTFGLTASYPIVRDRALRLTVAGSQDFKKLVDRSTAGETGNRTVRATTLGINGDVRHLLGSVPALTTFSAALVAGDSDQRNAGALATDAASRRANGGFAKLAYSGANLVQLSNDWSHTALLRGQRAGSNLDSSERISLGGPTGIRAYPVGEATGDDGWIASFNLRRSFGSDLSAAAFLDAGGVTLNRTTWAGWNAANPNLPNRYTLAGWGAGLDWRFHPSGSLSVSLAVPLGSNPGRDANNNNADGRGNHARLTFSLAAQF